MPTSRSRTRRPHGHRQINQWGGGTRSRVSIYSNEQSYNYWLPYDGDLSGVGNELCNVLGKLLNEFSLTTLKGKVNTITGGSQQLTKASQFYDLIKNGGGYAFNDNDDFAYSYIIDFDDSTLSEQMTDASLRFSQIKAGERFESEDDEQEGGGRETYDAMVKAQNEFKGRMDGLYDQLPRTTNYNQLLKEAESYSQDFNKAIKTFYESLPEVKIALDQMRRNPELGSYVRFPPNFYEFEARKYLEDEMTKFAQAIKKINSAQ